MIQYSFDVLLGFLVNILLRVSKVVFINEIIILLFFIFP